MSSSSPPPSAVADRRYVYRAIHLGTSFCLVFMAFGVSQSFQTSSDHKSQGSTALGILYACFTFGNFVSSFIVSTFGAKWCLVASSFTYVIFVAANIKYVMAVLYGSSALLGIGASVLWTAQGAFISDTSSAHERAHGLALGSQLGFFNGVFWSIEQVNNVIGNLLAAMLFKLNVDVSTIFIIMTAICGAGATTLTCLYDAKKDLAEMNNSAAVASPSAAPLVNPATYPNDSPDAPATITPPPTVTPFQQLLNMFASVKMLRLPELLILVPIMVYSGFSQTYIFGDFPPLIEDKAMKFFVLAAVGGADASSSMLMGKLSDRFGRPIVLSIGFVCSLFSIIFLGLWTIEQNYAVFFPIGILLGISDGVYNTQIYAILGSWFEGRAEAAFANFKLFQAGSTAIAFLVDNTITFYWKSVMTGVALIAGMLCLAIWDVAHRLKGGRGSVFDSSLNASALVKDAEQGVASPMLGDIPKSFTPPLEVNSLNGSHSKDGHYTPVAPNGTESP